MALFSLLAQLRVMVRSGLRAAWKHRHVRARLGMVFHVWANLRGMNCAVVALAVVTNGTWTRVFLTIHGERRSLWRAVEQDGNLLDILAHSRRNPQSRQTLFRAALLNGLHYVARVIITDTLKSYGAAKRELLPGVEPLGTSGSTNG